MALSIAACVARRPEVIDLHLSEDLTWYRAATLADRLAAKRKYNNGGSVSEDELARYRLQSWKSQRPFDRGSYFEQRLALDDLTEPQLRHLLVEPLEALRRRFPEPPGWLFDLNVALARSGASGSQHSIPDDPQSKPALGFLNVAAPLIEQALNRFDKRVAALMNSASALPFDQSTIKQILFPLLSDVLLNMLNRTMALELNIARLKRELEGNTPEERFQSFTARLRQPERQQAFLRDYPVLARLLVEQTQQWVEVGLEFLERLCQDWEEIRATFAPATEPGVLRAVRGDLADAHRGGRSVFIAKFASGFRLVYKPKSLAVDAHFQELLQWLNAQGAAPAFPTLKVLSREGYGWVEHVEARACQTVEEVRRFYRRQGGYLALLYLLEATDMHSGNLIACGEFPFLIDLEALFHPHRSQAEAGSPASANDVARRALSHSLLRIGLLPERVWGNSENEGVDMSGLGTVDGQMTPHALPAWEGIGTDAMRLVRKRKPIAVDKNRPRLAGAAVNVLDYGKELLHGFADTYSLLLSRKAELASDSGPLTRFAQDEVCMFLRSSRTYRRLLRESYHPDMLRDALDRERLLDLLWVEVEEDPDLARVIRVERDELLRGDIPLFTTRPGSRDLWLNTVERLPDFFAEPSLAAAQRRAAQLSREDCERQAWIIRASLATLPKLETQWSAKTVAPPAAEASSERLLDAAQAIGDRLAELALRGPDDASWLGLMLENERCWTIERCGLDLDAGLPGIALFLAYLGALTGQQRHTALAQDTLTAMQRQLADWGNDIDLIGGFDGWGGVIYVLTHLGALWPRADLLAQAEAIVERLPAEIEEDNKLDVFGGAAGCIGALRGLAHFVDGERAERVSDVAIQCGDHLLAQARQLPAGFAHGAAGLAWSLQTLSAWTGLERFRVAAHETLLHEQSLLAEPDSSAAWCRGAVGRGLARLNALSHRDAPALRAELSAALVTTLRQGFGHNHSLCHGEAGSLEFLLLASRALREPALEAQVQRRGAALLASIEQQGWRCGTPLCVETPGLLTGLAGIGFELLRLAAPELVPSVLLLEPPKSRLRES
jgi:type 2 lantibiotic biosynthesis protein LanM